MTVLKTANDVHAAYMDMKNKGQTYVGTLEHGPLFIDDWRDKEIRKISDRESVETANADLQNTKSQ